MTNSASQWFCVHAFQCYYWIGEDSIWFWYGDFNLPAYLVTTTDNWKTLIAHCRCISHTIIWNHLETWIRQSSYIYILITVEDPSEDYQRMRDFVDVRNCCNLDAFSKENLNKGFNKDLIKEVRQRLKLNRVSKTTGEMYLLNWNARPMRKFAKNYLSCRSSVGGSMRFWSSNIACQKTHRRIDWRWKPGSINPSR